MRVRTFWTIGNEHTDKVFYGCYLPDDTKFVKTGGGNEGWIEAGKAIDKEVDFPKCKIVFWKDKPFMGIGTKLADPAVVLTDRPVTLTKQKKVVQLAEPEFTDPAHVGPVIFITQMQMNNLTRGFFLAVIGKIPEVGGAIAGLLGLLWAEQKVDPNDLIKASEERMRHWVQGRLQEYDRGFLHNTLSGLRANLEEYHKAKGRKERARWFDICLAACERAMPFFVKDAYTPGTIDLAVGVATIHLTLLRERVLFPHEIFDDDVVNEPHFRETLKQTIADYQTFVRDVAIPGELKWRNGEIIDDREIGNSIYLTDWVTREVHAFRFTGRHQIHQGPQQVCLDFYRAQARNAYETQLIENTLHTALFWSRLDPDQQNVKPLPLDSVTWVGPLAGLSYAYGNEHDHKFGDVVSNSPGRITEIVVRAADLIDGLQFNAEGQAGAFAGNPKGGREHSVPVPAGQFLTKVETWFDFDLFAIRFHFSDGTQSQTFGTPGRGGVHQTAQFPRHHVTNVRIGRRMQELSCGFSPLPNFYD